MDTRIGKYGGQKPTHTILGIINRPPALLTRSLGNGYYVVVDSSLPNDFDLEAEIEKLRGELPKEKHEPKRKPKQQLETSDEDGEDM
jgi:hypothetical protein